MSDEVFEADRDDPIDWANAGWLERAAHIALNADRIFVRVHVNGKWQSVALVDLPDEEKIAHTRRLVGRNVEPVKLIQ